MKTIKRLAVPLTNGGEYVSVIQVNGDGLLCLDWRIIREPAAFARLLRMAADEIEKAAKVPGEERQ